MTLLREGWKVRYGTSSFPVWVQWPKYSLRRWKRKSSRHCPTQEGYISVSSKDHNNCKTTWSPKQEHFFFIQFPMDKIKSYSSSGRVDANQKANKIKLAWVGWMGLGTQLEFQKQHSKFFRVPSAPPDAISLFSFILLSDFVCLPMHTSILDDKNSPLKKVYRYWRLLQHLFIIIVVPKLNHFKKFEIISV